MGLLYNGNNYTGIDIYYLIFVLPAMLVALWAQFRVKSTFSKFNRVATANGLTGYQAARDILDRNGLQSIPIQAVGGNLTDHYDPKSRVIRLSESVINSKSVAAVGVAAHEAGHAVQYADGYAPIKLRMALVPITNIGSTLSFPLLLLGMFAGIPALTWLGIGLFSLVTLFQLVTLPVEFNASNRAIAVLANSGTLSGEELSGAKKVLAAAGLTYVASLAVSFMNLLRLVLVYGRRSNRR